MGEREPIVLRSAVAGDALAIYNVLSYSWHATYTPIWGAERAGISLPSISTIEVCLRSAARNRGAHFCVAIADDELIGFALSAPAVWLQRAFLAMLYVHPQHLDRGAGSQLLQDALNYHEHLRVMQVHVVPENEQAISFYARRGFRLVSRSYNLQPRMPVIVLQKPLSGVENSHKSGLRTLLFG